MHRKRKGIAMMRSILGRPFESSDRKSRSRRFEAKIEGLEGRNLMAAGSVVQMGGLVVVTPAPTGPNTAIVSYQSVNGVTSLDVNLNGANNYFSLSQVGFVYYEGSSASGAQTFENQTALHTVAWGGSGANLFEGGTGQDVFYGGSGSNTFDAGSGYDLLIGGSGGNTFNENTSGSGEVVEVGGTNSVGVPQNAPESYLTV
jgi:Ca2+-binding RTX toxin-like protein